MGYFHVTISRQVTCQHQYKQEPFTKMKDAKRRSWKLWKSKIDFREEWLDPKIKHVFDLFILVCALLYRVNFTLRCKISLQYYLLVISRKYLKKSGRLQLSEKANVRIVTSKLRANFSRVCKIAKSDYYLSHVSPSACNNSGPGGRIFHEIWYLSIFRKSVAKIQVPLNSDKNNGYFAWRLISVNSPYSNRCLIRKLYRKSKHTFYGQQLFISKIVPFMRNVEKYGRARHVKDDNIIRRIRIACWIIRTTDTRSKYVILIAFPR